MVEPLGRRKVEQRLDQSAPAPPQTVDHRAPHLKKQTLLFPLEATVWTENYKPTLASVVGCIVAPQKVCPSLNPWILYRRLVFARVIKLRVLGSSGIRVGPKSSDQCLYKRGVFNSVFLDSMCLFGIHASQSQKYLSLSCKSVCLELSFPVQTGWSKADPPTHLLI